MLDVLIILFPCVIAYIFLRSHGGEGFNIKGQFAPAHTAAGRRDRLLGSIILAMLVAAIAFVAARNGGASQPFAVIVPFLLGGLVVLVPFLLKKPRK